MITHIINKSCKLEIRYEYLVYIHNKQLKNWKIYLLGNKFQIIIIHNWKLIYKYFRNIKNLLLKGKWTHFVAI